MATTLAAVIAQELAACVPAELVEFTRSYTRDKSVWLDVLEIAQEEERGEREGEALLHHRSLISVERVSSLEEKAQLVI